MATETDNAGLLIVFLNLPVRGDKTTLYSLSVSPTFMLFIIYNFI